MEDYQKRVVVEKEDLDQKIVKLAAFLFSEKSAAVDIEEYERMLQQFYTMMEYSRCLNKRIVCFK